MKKSYFVVLSTTITMTALSACTVSDTKATPLTTSTNTSSACNQYLAAMANLTKQTRTMLPDDEFSQSQIDDIDRQMVNIKQQLTDLPLEKREYVCQSGLKMIDLAKSMMKSAPPTQTELLK